MIVFIPIIFMAAGVSLFAGVHFLLIGLSRRKERVFLAFGLLCLLIAGYMLLVAQVYRAASVVEVALIARLIMAIACLIYPMFVWFIGLYTDIKLAWVPTIAVAVPFGVLLVINFGSPFSVIFSGIGLADPLILPWGEQISMFSLRSSEGALYFYAASYIVFVYAFYRCCVLWRRGHRSKAWPLMFYFLIQFATVAHSGLIDILQVRSVYIDEFAFLALVVIMSKALGGELQQRTLAMESSLAELRLETDRRCEVEERMRYMAYHDSLTNLSNRYMLSEDLKKTKAHSQAFGCHAALLLIDLDHFKYINDSLGHEVGDALLQQVAERLRTALPEGSQPSRLGGDEFAIVLDGLAPDRREAGLQAVRVSHNLLNYITQPITIGNHELLVGASIGVALFSGDEDAIMRQADMALYHAKTEGRNSVQLFAPHMQHEANERLFMEKGLREALDRGGLALHYQPQVDADGRLIGAEALLRWQHPQRGSVPPSQFISVAEESGLIHLLGEYVLSDACNQLCGWQQAGVSRSVRIAINVSPWQLARKGFVDKIKSLGSHSGVDLSRLKIEITESSILSDIPTIASGLRSLSEAGIELSLDDFGTGYSSLTWLKHLPLHEIKIDRLFIRDIADAHHSKFVELIISIAHRMNLRVIAEGVETDSQYNTLSTMGCHAFQGFFIAPPLNPTEFSDWLTKSH